jgi:hypothetical protein
VNEAGVSSAQFVLGAALALILFVSLANLVVVQYGRGAIRSALEQGARAGSVTRSEAICETTARGVTAQLLGGRMSDGLEVRCVSGFDGMTASARVVFESWTLLTPDFEIELAAEAFLEPER